MATEECSQSCEIFEKDTNGICTLQTCDERTPLNNLTNPCGESCYIPSNNQNLCTETCDDFETPDENGVCVNLSCDERTPLNSSTSPCGLNCYWSNSNNRCVFVYSSCESIFDEELCESLFDGVNEFQNLSCVWVDLPELHGCINFHKSCEGVVEKNVCLSISDCEWNEDLECIKKRKTEGNIDNSKWLLIIIICLVFIYFYYCIYLFFYSEFCYSCVCSNYNHNINSL
jgi:hypothetical protein